MVIIHILSLLLWISPAGTDIKQIRVLYQQAPQDEAVANNLIRMLAEYSSPNSTILGYKGAATIVMAKHTVNPYSKYQYFKKGKDILENAIANDKSNLELRYLRYTIQLSIPGFLEYNQNLNEDKLFLQTQRLNITDQQLKLLVHSLLNS